MQWRGDNLSKKEGLEAFLLVVLCEELPYRAGHQGLG